MGLRSRTGSRRERASDHVCGELDNPDDAEMLATLEAANLKPATPEPHEQMLSIYTRAGRADLAKAEQQKLDQLAKSSKNSDHD